MERSHIAIFPFSKAMGHFLPLAELAKRLSHVHGFSVTLIFSKWMWTSQQPLLLQRLASSAPDIRFAEIPHITLDEDVQKTSFGTRISKFVLKAKPHLEDVLQSLRSSSPITAFITDPFCAEFLDVAAKLKIPSYILNSSSAAFACFLFHLPKLASEIKVSFKDADMELDLPGFPPIHASDLPSPLLDRSDSQFEWFVNLASRVKEATGLLINTFAELEEEAIQTLTAAGKPRIYPVGPLMFADSVTHHDLRCLKWLDLQPPSSVLFVAFGSGAVLSREKITDLAIGLEAGGHRFLWVLRGYKSGDSSSFETDISELLPEGFESRTGDRGLVVLDWVPQVQILSHPSTGGFLSHCGWSSTLESVCHGVPMIAWPQYAEQKMNKVSVVKQIKVGVDLKMDKEGFVRREEVERAVKELMEGEEGRKARAKVKELKEKAKTAMMEGGSTINATARLAADLSGLT